MLLVSSQEVGVSLHQRSKVSRELLPAPWEGASQQEHKTMPYSKAT